MQGCIDPTHSKQANLKGIGSAWTETQPQKE